MLITKGAVDLYTRDGLHFMRLPEGCVFLDYQVAFDLKSDIIFRAYNPDPAQGIGAIDPKWDRTDTMCYDPE